MTFLCARENKVYILKSVNIFLHGKPSNSWVESDVFPCPTQYTFKNLSEQLNLTFLKLWKIW